MSVRTAMVVTICLFLATFGLGLAGSLPIAADASVGADDVSSEPGVEIDSAVADATGETTVVVRVSDGPGGDRPATTAETETEAAGRVASMQSRAATTQTAFERFAAGNPHVQIERQFWITNAVVVTVDTDRIPLERLGMVDNVTAIHDDFAVEVADSATPAGQGAVQERGPVRPAVTSPSSSPNAAATPSIADSDSTYTAGLEQMGVPDAWETFGNRGAGVRVAVLDTGVDADHPDIDVAGWKDFSSSPSATPKDYGDHGTHVSGTIAGSNASGTHIGVAPEAELFHGAVLTECSNEGCSGSFSQVVGGIQWAVENDADVISMSLGVNGYQADFIDPIRSAEAAGTLVVSSSGNAGEDTSGSPGNVYETVSVGSSSTGATESVSPFSSGEEIDTAAAWGSDAPADWPSRYVVPDVVAPGENVYSAVPNGGYGTKRGTSMAAPHVAGATALLLSNADQDLSPTTIREWLAASAVDLDEAAHRQGDGRVDTFDLLLNHSRATMEPTITPTATNVSKPTTIAVDVDHPVEEYRWEFGDGTTATTTEPSVDHTFAELGPTTVTLTLVDATDSTTVSRDLEVVDEIRPTTAFDAPTEPIVGTNATFDASESTDNHGINRYEWSFGANTTEPVTTHEFMASGERDVTLTVTDPSGNTNATTTPVAVRDPPSVTIEQPAADATVAEHTVALEYTLANTDLANASGLEYRITDAEAEPNDEPVVDWTALPFEVTADSWTKTVRTDGLPDGTYTISARLVDDEGTVPPFDTATTNRTVTVETPPPALSFDVHSTHADYHIIGQQNPANVTVSVTEPRHESTTITIRNDTGALVTDWNVTNETGGGERVALEWPATDGAGEPVESGSYEITARAADDLGNTNVSSTTVAVDTDTPTVAIDDVTGTAAADGDVFVNESGEVVVAVTADDGRAGPEAADHVSVSLESTATNYQRTVAAERDPSDETRWAATVVGESLPDEGRYEVRATATDAAANTNATLADASVWYDRTSPQLSAVISDLDEANGTATVRVRSSEPLRDAPTIDVARPDGTATAVEPLAEASPTDWTGSLEIDESGRYNLTTSGVDLAANAATETATATVQSTTTENRTATIAAEQTGAFVHLNTTADVEGGLAAVSETRTPPRQLEPNATGIGFLTVALGEDLESVRSNATIGIPAEQERLPESVTVDDDRLTAQWYDEGTVRWERRNLALRAFEAAGNDTGNDSETADATDIGTADATDTDTDTGTDDTTDTETAAAIEDDPRIEGEYWVATVPDPATAGVTLVDDSPPELVASTPATGATLANDTGTVSVELEYADDLSGVDVSSLELAIDGERVTDDAQVQLTSRTAVYEDLAVDAGETYEIALDIADRGGNERRLETRFEVETDGAGDAGGSSGGGGGGLSFGPVDDSGPDRPEPTAAIAIDPEPAAVGEEITFSGAPSTDEEREIIRYEWVIDGTDRRGETVTTAFDEAGTYDVELTVTNDFAGNDTTATTVTVVDEPDEETPGADENATDDPDDAAGGDELAAEDRGDDTVPGFGVLVSLGALLAVAARSLRRGR